MLGNTHYLKPETYLEVAQTSASLPVFSGSGSRVSANFEPYGHFVAFLKIFCFSDARFDGHDVAAIFREQGSLPLGFADPNMDRNHSPTISHRS